MNTLGQALLLLIVMGATVASADLPRRTYLGLQFDLNDRSGPGLLVSAVLPESAAKLAGLQVGDRLTSVGSVVDLKAFDELRLELAGTPAGTRIPLRWYRGRVVRRVSPPLGVLPTEAVPESLVRYESVSVNGVRQRLILSEPLEGAEALVFYLQGLGCGSVDFWFDTDNTAKRLIDGWAGTGFATARLEKQGVGDSEGSNCGELSFEDELKGYGAAIGRLVELGFANRIFLFGHALGGLMAPQLVREDVAGIMVYGTLGVPWLDYTMTNFERQDRLAGLLEQDIERRRAAFQQESGRSAEFFEQLAAVDPERVWRRVWQPVLAVHGEFDWTSDRADHERIARLTGGKFLSIAGLDHDFLSYHTLEQSFVSRGTGVFDPAIVEATVTWVRANATFGDRENSEN